MSTPTLATRSRWMDWQPKTQISAETAGTIPTKTSKTVSVVFVGAVPAEIHKIEKGPEQPGMPWEEWQATALNRIFLEQGVTRQPGRIKPETVRHGIEKGARRREGER